MKKYILLDRDGTINADKQYLSDPDELELIPGAAQAIKRLNDANIGAIILTNQSGVGRGYFDEPRLNLIHARLRELLLLESGASVDGIYYCPHAPAVKCDCRKPLTGLVQQALRERSFDPSACVMVGDKEADIGLGHALGGLSVLVRTGDGKKTERDDSKADYIVDDLSAAVSLILSKQALRSGR